MPEVEVTAAEFLAQAQRETNHFLQTPFVATGIKNTVCRGAEAVRQAVVEAVEKLGGDRGCAVAVGQAEGPVARIVTKIVLAKGAAGVADLTGRHGRRNSTLI